MKSLQKNLQYTIRGIDSTLDKELRSQARRTGSSLNQAALDALMRGAGVGTKPVKNHDFDRFFGDSADLLDDEFFAILAEQRQIDTELWQ